MIKISRKLIEILNRKDTQRFLIFVIFSTLFFIGINFFQSRLPQVGYYILIIELIILVLASWALAGHAVMKSLFVVGASLSLIIFLAQSYCSSLNVTESSDAALQTLVAFSLMYIGFDFFKTLYKDVTEKTKKLKEANHGKNPWILLIPFAFFLGLFLVQLYQVVNPILNSLCIYK